MHDIRISESVLRYIIFVTILSIPVNPIYLPYNFLYNSSTDPTPIEREIKNQRNIFCEAQIIASHK